MGLVLLAGGILGSLLGVQLFEFLRRMGQYELAVSLLYVLLLGQDDIDLCGALAIRVARWADRHGIEFVYHLCAYLPLLGLLTVLLPDIRQHKPGASASPCCWPPHCPPMRPPTSAKLTAKPYSPPKKRVETANSRP